MHLEGCQCENCYVQDAWEQQLSPSVSPNGLDTPHSVHSSLTVEDSSLDQVASGWHNGTHSSSMHAHTRFLDASCCAPMRTPAWQDCLALRNSQLGHAAYDTSYGSFGTSQAYSRLTGFGIVQGQNPFVPQVCLLICILPLLHQAPLRSLCIFTVLQVCAHQACEAGQHQLHPASGMLMLLHLLLPASEHPVSTDS